jgi:outer membrane usher protein
MISLPLDQWLRSKNSLYTFYNMNAANPGETTYMAGLAGTALEENNLNWSVQQGYGSKSSTSGNLDLSYQGTYGELASSYSYSSQSRRFSYGIAGGAVVHAQGLTLGQTLGESVSLVEVPGAAQTSVSNHSGVRTDFRGYTVVPYVTPYRLNDIVLNSETLPDNIELTTNTVTVVPTRGAVVRSKFGGQIGIKGFIRLIDPAGKVVPFGATVTLPNTENTPSNFVGEEGQVYLTGLRDHGSIFATWGNEANKQCRASYDFRDKPTPATGIQQIEAICQ